MNLRLLWGGLLTGLVASVGLVLTTSSLTAQNPGAAGAREAATAPAAANVDDEEIVILNPFVVEGRTRGYTATTSLAGGRLDTELRDTAVAISVLTPEFIEDIGASNFLEAISWAPNAVSEYEISGDNLFNDYRVNFRSLGAGFQARNYFLWYINSDFFNVGRVDVTRGPNSVVFGDAGIAGMANVSTKRALFANQYEVTTALYSEGGLRVTLDANYQVTETSALRAGALYDHRDFWQDFAGYDRDGFYATATWQPFPQTRIDIEFEWGLVDRRLAEPVNEEYSDWDGVTAVTVPGEVDANAGLRRIRGDRFILISGAPELGFINLDGFALTAGSGRELLDRPMESPPPGNPQKPYLGWHMGPPNRTAENEYHSYSLFVNQQIGSDLFIELAYNRQWQDRDVENVFFSTLWQDPNAILPDGSPNPYFGEFYGENQPRYALQANTVDEIRGALAYVFNMRDWARHRLLLAGGYREDDFHAYTYLYAWANNPDEPNLSNRDNRIVIRRYANERDLDLVIPAVEPVSGREIRAYRDTGRLEQKTILYTQAALSTAWFNERLHTLVGYRIDDFTRKEDEFAIVDETTREITGFGPLVTSEEDPSIETLTASVVYHVTDWLSLMANYGESFFPIGNAFNINNDPLPAFLNEGHDLGMRITLFDQRLIGTVTYYENTQENVTTNGASGDINAIWGALEREDREVPGGYDDIITYEGKGWEFDVTANLTGDWQLIFNLALPETSQVEGLIDTRNYYNQFIGEWTAALAELENPLDRAVVETNVADVESFLESFAVGRILNNTFDYTANLFTNYNFTGGGVLDGFSVGGGVRMRGERLIDNRPGDPFAYIYADSYEIYVLKLGYETSWRGFDVEFQLNIDNLFDDTIIRPRSYGTVRAGSTVTAVPNAYNVLAPREWRLTLRVAF